MKRLPLLLPVLAVSACSMEPHYTRPAAPIPASLPHAAADASQAALPSLNYRDVFRDARLVALIEAAMANNRDLRIAAANIAEARANLRIQRAQQLPQIDANGQAGYSDRGQGAKGTGDFAANGNVTAFEVDLFGRLAALTHTEQNRLFATQAGARTVRLVLIADLADSWLAYASDATLLDLAQKTVAASERVLALTRLKFEHGVAPRSDMLQAEQVLQTARADRADQRTALDQDSNALRLLVGADIAPALLPSSVESIADAVVPVPVGMDSQVLLRRPDVVQAEYELRAANADVGAARAALFPTLSLTGALGFASTGLSGLFTGGAFAHSETARLSYPLFRAGALRAGVDASKARRDAALATYEHTIQTAFREVADGLARAATIGDKLDAVAVQERSSASAFRLAELRYRGAVEPFLSTLDAQRSLYAAQRTLAQTRYAALHNRVVMYRTIGGDALIDATPQGPAPAPGR